MEKIILLCRYSFESKLLSFAFVILFNLTVLVLSGCAYNPQALQMKPGMVPDYYQFNNEISLKNNAKTEKLEAWTESLILSLSNELSKKGATITDNSKNILYLDIYDTYENPLYAYWANKCVINVNIKTSNGYTKQIEIMDISGLSCQRACGFCITKAAADILSDRQIIKDLDATVSPQ